MGTLADALNDATAAENAAVDGLNAAAALLRNKAGLAQAAIDRFVSQPLLKNFWVDPVNGNDANDGNTIATAKRSIDNVIANVGSQSTAIYLLGDATITRRFVLLNNLTIYGVQPASNEIGYIQFNRTISFLGTAINSPDPYIGTSSAGITFSAGVFLTANINFVLPDVPAGIVTRAHICSAAFLSAILITPTITVSGSNAAALLGSFNGGRITATLSPTLGAGAAGRLFFGIAAGANPNSSWSYSTNLTSA